MLTQWKVELDSYHILFANNMFIYTVNPSYAYTQMILKKESEG